MNGNYVVFKVTLHLMEVQEKRLADAEGRERVGRMESSVETYTLPFVKQIASGNLLYLNQEANQCSVTT